MQEIVYTDRGDIDWCQPQPPGVYRCDRGWEAGGYQYGCQDRVTTDAYGLTGDADRDHVTGEAVALHHLCTQHALIAQLGAINSTMARETDAANGRAEDYIELLKELAQSVSNVREELSDISWTLRPFWRRWFSGIRESLWARRKQRSTARQDRTNKLQMISYSQAPAQRYGTDSDPDVRPDVHKGQNYFVQADNSHRVMRETCSDAIEQDHKPGITVEE